MGWLEKLLRIIEYLTKAMYVFAALAICALFLLMFCDVSGRFLFNSPITGTAEVSQYLLVVIAFLPLGYAQFKGAHIKIDTIISHFPEKLRISLNILTFFMAISFFVVMATQIGERAYLDWADKLLLPRTTVRLPMWWPSAAAMVGCVLLVIALLVQFVRSIVQLQNTFKNG